MAPVRMAVAFEPPLDFLNCLDAIWQLNFLEPFFSTLCSLPPVLVKGRQLRLSRGTIPGRLLRRAVLPELWWRLLTSG